MQFDTMYSYVRVFSSKVQVDVEGGSTLIVSGGGLIHSTYKVAQFHFHWGSDNTKGSEHTYNGISYPMEVFVNHS